VTETQPDVNQRDGDARDNGEHVDDLAEAYALGALDDHERRRVDFHLASCTDCRELIDDLHRVTALLSFASPLSSRPSPAAKASLLARVQQTQQPPQPAVRAPAAPPDRPPARPAAPARAFWPRWGLAVVPAALAVLLVTSLVWSYSLSRRLDAADQQRATYQNQLTWLYGGQPGAQIYTFQPMRQNSGAGGRLCVDGDTTSAMVVAWSLDPSRQHVLWAMNPDGTKTKLMPLTVSASGNVVQMVKFGAGFNGSTTLMIATDGPNANMELMLAPTQAPAPATPSAPTATSWPYYIKPIPVAY
jgi:type II secretory pathway pseudopilin PulG